MSEPKLNYNSTPDEVEAIILGKFPDEYEKGIVSRFIGDLIDKANRAPPE